MKKTVTKETIVCDSCGKDCGSWASYQCLGCRKHYCYECGQNAVVKYSHGVYFSGSGDGEYCKECDRKALANGDELHAAYLKIQSIREGMAATSKEWDSKREEAESNLKRIQESRTTKGRANRD